MKAPEVDFHQAGSVDEAVEVLDAHMGDARPLAGGQSLLPMMAMRIAGPAVLVDINEIPGLDGINVEAGVLTLGALARYSDVERSPLVTAHAPLLAEMLAYVADRPIRNRGTVAGSLAQADPNGEAPLAAFTLDATVVVRGPVGERIIPVRQMIVGPYDTVLEPSELIVAVRFPADARRRHVFCEVARRHGDYAIVAVAATGIPGADPGRWEQLAVGLGAAGDTPVLVDTSGVATLDETGIAELAERAVAVAEPSSDTRASAEYRRHLIGIHSRRALARLAEKWGDADSGSDRRRSYEDKPQ